MNKMTKQELIEKAQAHQDTSDLACKDAIHNGKQDISYVSVSKLRDNDLAELAYHRGVANGIKFALAHSDCYVSCPSLNWAENARIIKDKILNNI